ncbi:hypothetical protein EXIGLDRAFT_628056 [Exidia glandulosa HHB12029]|uniref:Uncharacterized protein n=1 Tax=Exidia glandulosa HHB12029 TaxID=1314781 RepID=A0A165C311_EXIGL|nr:hypothetical protein EXIGLDRAFT_628056 [Exidia glandulosa HHB12029]
MHATTQIATAAALDSPGSIELGGTFPYPLVLPEDDIALDPSYPAQSFRSWLKEPDRNEIVPTRSIVYVARPPSVSQSAHFMRSWSGSDAHRPSIQHITSYIKAFYHGLPVRTLPEQLSFTTWDDGPKTSTAQASKASTPRYVGINTSSESIRLRTRACPDKLYPRQLNSDDLLDAAQSVLPEDAYALILLVEHDLWEGPGDTFICGRAYGASRIAVVSMARYDPVLDVRQGVERVHAWPASHCAAYIQHQCANSSDAGTVAKKKRKTSKAPAGEPALAAQGSPLYSAVAAFKEHSADETDVGLWLSRVCRTAVHELGHCFGLDHCVYLACAMQGTASIREDARQPPYLCPVDLAKVLRATGQTDGGRARTEALLEFCRSQQQGSSLFAAFAAWMEAGR